jgi:OOP family OmpA-OmpF porin
MQRKSTLVAAAALAALVLSGTAAAQSSGWYIGGGAGSAKADFVRSDFTGLASGAYAVDNSEIGPRFFAGYRAAPNFAIEFGLAGFGSFRHTFNDPVNGVAVYDYDASALTVAAAGNLPVGGGFSLNGRVGVAFTAATLDLRRNNGTATVPFCPDSWWYTDCASQSTNLYWGLGAQFDFNPRWGIRLDYDNYGEVGEEFETGRADIEAWSVNVVFRF